MTHDNDSRLQPRLVLLVRIWCVLAAAALVVGGFAYLHRPATSPVRAPEAKPVVLVGVRGPDGRVCTERAVLPGSERWSCVTWLANPGHARIVEPKTYTGVCTHLVADQDLRRWTCPGPVHSPTRRVRPEFVT